MAPDMRDKAAILNIPETLGPAPVRADDSEMWTLQIVELEIAIDTRDALVRIAEALEEARDYAREIANLQASVTQGPALTARQGKPND